MHHLNPLHTMKRKEWSEAEDQKLMVRPRAEVGCS